ncbi:MAG TPA: arginase, partial [Puia sp.]
MQHLKVYTKQDVMSLTTIRKFETRLGERISVAANPASLSQSLEQTQAEYVLIGIPEDVGVKADGGVGGADTAWIPFLQNFLNIQSNDFLQGES